MIGGEAGTRQRPSRSKLERLASSLAQNLNVAIDRDFLPQDDVPADLEWADRYLGWRPEKDGTITVIDLDDTEVVMENHRQGRFPGAVRGDEMCLVSSDGRAGQP